MKVKITVTVTNEYRQFYEIEIDGTQVFSVGDGEPEDSNLSRDFNDVFAIPDLMRRVYEAGQQGEELFFEHEDVDET